MTNAKKKSDTRSDDVLLDRAQQIVGHSFADRSLLRRALTHPSVMSDAAAENDGVYERMEFLGDSILGFLIAEEAFQRFPDMREGGMTRIRVSLIAGSVQSAVARDLGLADVLILGKGEQHTGGRGMASALENAYEALTAAIYLDAGLDAARQWMLRTMGPLITEETAASPHNPKSALQELVQAEGEAPVYVQLGQSGPPHSRTFSVAVQVDGKQLGQGSGRTKREAEAAAAAVALKRLTRPRTRRRSQPPTP
jgi:ribonuclease-3